MGDEPAAIEYSHGQGLPPTPNRGLSTRPQERWENIVGRIAEALENDPIAYALLESTGWRGGPELLVDELDRLAPEEAVAVTGQVDEVKSLRDLKLLDDLSLVALFLVAVA